MYKAIIYKEWIKTRKVAGLLGLVFAGIACYTFLEIMQQLRASGAVAYWESIIQKDIGLIPLFKYLPVLAGILLAIVQYVPEMQNKRLKLTLHLPLSESGILSAMLLYGTGITFLLTTLTFGVLLIGLRTTFAAEIVAANCLNALPWFLASLAGYLITAWICLEPVWKQRVLNSIPGLCALSFFFIRSKSGAYSSFLPYLVLFIIVCFTFSFYSTIRFKEGKQ